MILWAFDFPTGGNSVFLPTWPNWLYSTCGRWSGVGLMESMECKRNNLWNFLLHWCWLIFIPPRILNKINRPVSVQLRAEPVANKIHRSTWEYYLHISNKSEFSAGLHNNRIRCEYSYTFIGQSASGDGGDQWSCKVEELKDFGKFSQPRWLQQVTRKRNTPLDG